ncbi:MAG: ribose 5-phosphate isomerase [Bacteroidota bacterium]|jgi:ribose 5-phosphate isomerase B
MKIIIGSDHAGFSMKEDLKAWLSTQGHTCDDKGCHSAESVDYPDYAHLVAQTVESEDSLGILLCGSANGVCITANKHAGIRAALCWTKEISSLARQHNDANIVCIPARFISLEEAKEIVIAFITTAFEGGRHQNRVNKICM